LKDSIIIKIIYKSKKLRDFLEWGIWFTQMMTLKFYKDPEIVKFIQSVKKKSNILISPIDAFNVYSIAKIQSNLEGDMAEVGVYTGGSAKLICKTKGNRKLHLFDTFEGLPQITEKDIISKKILWKHEHFKKTNLESVKKYLSEFDMVYFYKGKFPDTAEPVKDCKFSFIHLDADLYTTTLNALQFFYPRLVKGGIIISHDYNADSVRNAFDEFFKDKQQLVIELGGIQCLVIKN